MSIGKGINLSAGFDLNAQQPLDSRDVFETITERDSLPQINTYEGMKCYVKETKSNYQYMDGNWINIDVDNISVKYGITPPESEDTLIWIDTSNSLSESTFEDTFVEEVRASMVQAITPLSEEINNIKDKMEAFDYVVLKSPNGNRYKVTVNNDGTLITTKI